MTDRQAQPISPTSPAITPPIPAPGPTPIPVAVQQGLQPVLAAMCRLSDSARGGVIRRVDSGRIEVVTIHPVQDLSSGYPEWLKPYGAAIADVLPETAPAFAQTKTRLVRQPEKKSHGFVWSPGRLVPADQRWAFVLESENPQVAEVREKLSAMVGVLEQYTAVTTNQDSQTVVERLTRAITVLSAINRPRRFLAAAMALCNELAATWGCERVSIGLLKGRYVRLKATSHSAHFSRKMQIVQDIESAMEECLDQDVEVVHPASAQ
ncbi:hypothetical protein ACFL6U_30660, partial [Planctomycetota bacterium]